MHPAHTPKTLEIVELALGFASIACMRFKQAMAVTRPIDLSTEIQPIIPTPSHSAYPSGHATEAYMIAYTLPSLLAATVNSAGVVAVNANRRGAYEDQLKAQAKRIAVNRTVAGVHFPIDSYAGSVLAQSLAEYFLYRLGIPGKVHARTVNPFASGLDDFKPDDATQAAPKIELADDQLPSLAPTKIDPLRWMAERAIGEWGGWEHA